MPAKRAAVHLDVEPSTQRRFDRVCERQGMTQIAVLSRLVRWLADQDELVQASVLGALSDERLVLLAAERMRRLQDTRG